MKPIIPKPLLGLLLVPTLTACMMTTSPQPVASMGKLIYGTDGVNLVAFGSQNPGVSVQAKAISGLQPAETVVGLDFRPKDGKLYAVSSASRLYTLNTATGALTPVGSAPLSPGLDADVSAGVDFNPMADRLRIHTSTGQNLRINPDNAMVADGDANKDGVQPDGALVYAAGQANAGQTANLTATGYTNSVAGATSTVLYAIDSSLDTLVMLASPNNGQVTTVGPLGLDVTGATGFDISPGDNVGLLSLTMASSSGFSGLYTVNLATGMATLVDRIGHDKPLLGIAVSP